MVKICFDLDGVICETKNSIYRSSKPKIKVIKYINYLYDQKHHITIFTARFMGRNNDKIKYAKKQGLALTKKQLKKWGVKYHKLILKKPLYNVFIDDRNINTDDFFDNFDNYREDYLKQVEDNIIQLEDINH